MADSRRARIRFRSCGRRRIAEAVKVWLCVYIRTEGSALLSTFLCNPCKDPAWAFRTRLPGAYCLLCSIGQGGRDQKRGGRRSAAHVQPANRPSRSRDIESISGICKTGAPYDTPPHRPIQPRSRRRASNERQVCLRPKGVSGRGETSTWLTRTDQAAPSGPSRREADPAQI